jgi:hypothetical protein
MRIGGALTESYLFIEGVRQTGLALPNICVICPSGGCGDPAGPKHTSYSSHTFILPFLPQHTRASQSPEIPLFTSFSPNPFHASPSYPHRLLDRSPPMKPRRCTAERDAVHTSKHSPHPTSHA